MNKSVDKMILCLRTLTERAKDIIDITSMENLEEFGMIGSAFALLAMWLEDSTFKNFRVVSDDMLIFNAIFGSSKEDSDLSFQFKDKDITNILFYLIRHNIQNGILDEKKEIIDIATARADATKEISILELLSMKTQSTFFDTYKEINRIIMSKVTQKSNEVFLLKDQKPKGIKQSKIAHNTIKQFYLDKENTYTQKDIEIVVKCIKDWGLNEIIATAVRNTLENKLAKRKEPSKVIEIKKVVRVSKPIITKKQYREIMQELESKFDFERMEPQPYATLTPEEIFHCVSLMEELNFSFRKIEIFVEKSFKKAREEMKNIYIKIKTLKEKIIFYGIQNETVSDAMSNIELYLPEYENSKPEDVEEWYQIIDTEIEKANAYIPKGYEYEKSLVFKPKEEC